MENDENTKQDHKGLEKKSLQVVVSVPDFLLGNDTTIQPATQSKTAEGESNAGVNTGKAEEKKG